MTVNRSFAVLNGVYAIAVIALVAACGIGNGAGKVGDTPKELEKEVRTLLAKSRGKRRRK